MEEMQEIDGGIFFLVAKFVVGALIGGAIVEVITEGWEKCYEDYQSGYNEARAK
jgi:hypothetical protein